MHRIKHKLAEALAMVETVEQQQARELKPEAVAAKVKEHATKTPSGIEMAALLTSALSLLEYATWQGGSYGQMNTLRFQQQGQELASQISRAIGVRPYQSIQEAINNGN